MSSDRAKHWAWSQLDVSGGELLVLLAMADNVGEKLICYASLATLGEMARQSERTVQRNLEHLEAAGKIARVDRPGRTTLFELLIPADFGKKTPARKPTKTPDNMTGVEDASRATSTPDNLSGVTPVNVAGVGPTTDWRGPPSNWRGTPANLSSDSSLNPSLPIPSQSAHARASPASSPARAAASPTEGDGLLLKNRAMLAGITPRLPDEPRDRFLRRLDAAEGQRVVERAEQTRREREQASANAEKDAAA